MQTSTIANSKHLEDAVRGVEKIEHELSNLRRLLALAQGVDEGELAEPMLQEHQKKRIELWCRIYNKGGHVDKTEMYRIARQVGYDRRGLGGFFTGRKPSLQMTPDDRIFLTKEATRDLERWTGQTIEDYAKNFS